METKTLKISEAVHKELKIYVANTGRNMTELADAAILSLLISMGHKLSNAKPIKIPKIKSKQP